MGMKGRGESGEWRVCVRAYMCMSVCAHVYKCVYVKELNWNCPTQEIMFFLEAVGCQIKSPVRVQNIYLPCVVCEEYPKGP